MNDVRKSIGWADYTWNPVTGCKRHCSYCYARRIHERFNKTPFSEIVFHEKRLFDKQLGNGNKIFVGSMSDIQYWKPEWVHRILDTISHYPGDTFMFLSKDPRSYFGFNWPGNAMLGLTITESSNPNDRGLDFHTRTGRTFLSIEPLLGTINPSYYFDRMELIIVGAMTGQGAVAPKPEWIQSAKDNIPTKKIYWKNNIKKYL